VVRQVKELVMGEIFLAGVVVLLLIVMIDEYLEAYDEWRKDIDDES
jgi:hypothetical protein